jgi:nucleoside-diphosphate-sugar epimerase
VGGPYRQAKIAMERRLIAGPLPAVILQPTIVYGPGSALWTDRPLAALRRGGVVLPDPPGLCPAVHGADVAGAALAALALPDPGRERFLISGPDRMTWADFYRGYAGLLGQGEVRLEPLADLAARLGPAPVPGAAPSGPSAAARISAALRRVLGSRRFDRLLARLADRRGPAVTWPDRAALALYAARGDIDTSAARDRLGFTPRLSFAQGLETIRAQYRL